MFSKVTVGNNTMVSIQPQAVKIIADVIMEETFLLLILLLD